MVMLFLAGCQAEEVVIENHEHGHGISIVRKKFKDFDKLPSLTKEILKQQDLAYRGGTNDPLYDFTIDSSAVTQAIKDGKTHYTMPIMRENSSDESFENLVITDDGVEKEAFLIKYFPSNEYYERLKTNIHAPYIGGMNLQKIDLDNLQQRGTFNTVCVTYTQAYCNWSKDGNGPMHIAGPGCTQIIGSNTWEECFSFTVLDPEPEKFVNIDPGSNSGGGSSGGNSNPNNPNPTQPNPSNPQDPNLTNPADGTIISEPLLPGLAIKAFKSTLNSDQLAWWNDQNNSSAVSEIINYLDQNNVNGMVSAEAMGFAQEIINTVLEYLDEYGNSVDNNNIANDFVESLFDNEVSDDDANTTLDIGPDCSSFNFINTGSNWQMSAVKNIRFVIVLVDKNGVNINHIVNFQQPILFGCPRNLLVGNTDITAGMAASLSTSTLAFSMKQTVNKYGTKKVSSEMVKLYFEGKLKYNYPNYLPGGRVNFNAQNYPSSVVPTQYQSSMTGNADCG